MDFLIDNAVYGLTLAFNGRVSAAVCVTCPAAVAVLFIIGFFLKNKKGFLCVFYAVKNTFFCAVSLFSVGNALFYGDCFDIRSAIVFSIAVYAVFSLITALSAAFYKDKKVVRSEKEDDEEKETAVLKNEDITERAVEKLTCSEYVSEAYAGYIDTDYLRELVRNLKEKNLEEKDAFEIENLEVYLLNFVSRQPTRAERQILSEYVGMLIKKLAKYSAA